MVPFTLKMSKLALNPFCDKTLHILIGLREAYTANLLYFPVCGSLICSWFLCNNRNSRSNGGARGWGGGGAAGARTPSHSFDRLRRFLSHFVSECLKNKAQIARESIKNPKASRPLNRPWTPTSGFIIFTMSE